MVNENPKQRSPAPVDVTIGANLKAYREDRGWSQQELADKLADNGVRIFRQAVQSIEKGERTLKLSEAVALANLLHIRAERLVSGPIDRLTATVAQLVGDSAELSASLKTVVRDMYSVSDASRERRAGGIGQIHEDSVSIDQAEQQMELYAPIAHSVRLVLNDAIDNHASGVAEDSERIGYLSEKFGGLSGARAAVLAERVATEPALQQHWWHDDLMNFAPYRDEFLMHCPDTPSGTDAPSP